MQTGCWVRCPISTAVVDPQQLGQSSGNLISLGAGAAHRESLTRGRSSGSSELFGGFAVLPHSGTAETCSRVVRKQTAACTGLLANGVKQFAPFPLTASPLSVPLTFAQPYNAIVDSPTTQRRHGMFGPYVISLSCLISAFGSTKRGGASLSHGSPPSAAPRSHHWRSRRQQRQIIGC